MAVARPGASFGVFQTDESILMLLLCLHDAAWVQGLRNLERMRLAELLQEPTPATFASGRTANSSAPSGGGWRRRFQRYRGPFIEQLAVDDLKADPKPWAVFWRGSQAGGWADAYNLPASLDVLHERTEVKERTELVGRMLLCLPGWHPSHRLAPLGVESVKGAAPGTAPLFV